jgi:hypothetical protein
VNAAGKSPKRIKAQDHFFDNIFIFFIIYFLDDCSIKTESETKSIVNCTLSQEEGKRVRDEVLRMCAAKCHFDVL